MAETHYIPAYTRINGRKQETVCRVWVEGRAHSNEPTCPDCRAYVEAEPAREEDDDETMRQLAKEFPDVARYLGTK